MLISAKTPLSPRGARWLRTLIISALLTGGAFAALGCSDDPGGPATADSAGDGDGDSSGDGDGDGDGDGGGRDAATGLDFGAFGRDGGARNDRGPVSWQAPADWDCRGDFALDWVCDCGCGAVDPACDLTGCTDAACLTTRCDVCFGDGGQPVACDCVNAEGGSVDCKAPPTGGQCAATALADGRCDCGCGEADPDCAGDGCTEAGCMASACEACHDAFGRDVPCLGLWVCSEADYRDGSRCDCGCGQADPDCGAAGCSGAECEDAACDTRHDAAGKPLRPPAWTCPADDFAAGDGCDCGCGAPDPDCAGEACTEPGCQAPACDRCRDGDGGFFSCLWQCGLDALGDGVKCDCGCGVADPDCRDDGCAGPGCFEDACDRCQDTAGGPSACMPSQCAAALQSDGVCDCGCRWRDPDCPASGSCEGPGCSASACGRCHAADGSAVACADWACALEKQDADDGCNCGCGLPDPDCSPPASPATPGGCAMPGCQALACDTCRATDGQPTGCTP